MAVRPTNNGTNRRNRSWSRNHSTAAMMYETKKWDM